MLNNTPVPPSPSSSVSRLAVDSQVSLQGVGAGGRQRFAGGCHGVRHRVGRVRRGRGVVGRVRRAVVGRRGAVAETLVGGGAVVGGASVVRRPVVGQGGGVGRCRGGDGVSKGAATQRCRYVRG